MVHRALESDGVTIRVGQSVAEVTATGPRSGALRLDDGSTVEFDRLLVAVGRQPRTRDLGLDTIGVELDEHDFVVVDPHLRTTNPSGPPATSPGTRSSPTPPASTAVSPRATRSWGCAARWRPRRCPG